LLYLLESAVVTGHLLLVAVMLADDFAVPNWKKNIMGEGFPMIL